MNVTCDNLQCGNTPAHVTMESKAKLGLRQDMALHGDWPWFVGMISLTLRPTNFSPRNRNYNFNLSLMTPFGSIYGATGIWGSDVPKCGKIGF